jgi:predicted RNase H-like nuclease
VVSVLGVDGCPGGWIGARLDGAAVTWHLLPDATSVLALAVDAVAIDIPIGLPDHAARACDTAARRLLGRPGTTVFTAPMRAVLDAT